MNLIINKYLVEALLQGKKTAVMMQGEFKIGDRIDFFYHPGQSTQTLLFATAKIYAAAALKINPKAKSIFKHDGLGWKALPRENVKRVIEAEGIKREDAFWAAHDQPLQVYQIYFDELVKLI